MTPNQPFTRGRLIAIIIGILLLVAAAWLMLFFPADGQMKNNINFFAALMLMIGLGLLFYGITGGRQRSNDILARTIDRDKEDTQQGQ